MDLWTGRLASVGSDWRFGGAQCSQSLQGYGGGVAEPMIKEGLDLELRA